MKKSVVWISVIISLVSILSSCSHVYFNQAQPVDSKNIYKFPLKFRGVWTDNSDSVIIGKTYFKDISYTNTKKAKNIVDTSSLFITKNNKIYIISSESELKVKGGFPYTLKNDTLYYTEREITEINLSKSTFLRKLDNDYILNIKQKNQWWEIILIAYTKESSILFRLLSKEDLENLPNAEEILSTEQDNYYQAKWTADELVKIVENGSFSDTILNLDINKKNPLKKN